MAGERPATGAGKTESIKKAAWIGSAWPYFLLMEKLLVLIVGFAGQVYAQLSENAGIHVGQDDAGMYLGVL